jgi:hypothetical protein
MRTSWVAVALLRIQDCGGYALHVRHEREKQRNNDGRAKGCQQKQAALIHLSGKVSFGDQEYFGLRYRRFLPGDDRFSFDFNSWVDMVCRFECPNLKDARPRRAFLLNGAAYIIEGS